MLNLARIKNQIEIHDTDVAQIRVKFIRIIKVVFEDILRDFFRDHPEIDAIVWYTETGAVRTLDTAYQQVYTWLTPEAQRLHTQFGIEKIFVTNFENQVIVQFFDKENRRLP